MDKQKLGSKKFMTAGLILIIVIQLACYIFLFANYKTSYHEDEFFSYSLSNSYYYPFIYGSKHQVVDNYNVWIKGSDYRYYIETSPDTRFKYDSVWYNQKSDVHPPLYYAVLHTISSFFPDRFSWWWGFGINLVCFAVSQIFLFKIASKLSGSDICGLAACFFWGSTLIGQNTQLFIRMYSMLTMFILIYIYLSMLQFESSELSFKKQLIPLALVSFCGAMTQHFFLIFAFFYTLLQCIVLLIRKRFKDFFGYGCAVLAGVLLSIAAFPATISHLFSKDAQQWFHDIDFGETFHFLLRATILEMTGKNIGYWQSSAGYLLAVIAVIVIVLLIPVLWLFRKNPKLKAGAVKLKNALKVFVFEMDLSFVFAFASVIAYYCVLSNKITYFDIGDAIDRYIMPQCAVLAVLFVVALFWLTGKLSDKIKFKYIKQVFGAVIAAGLCFLIVFQNYTSGEKYRIYCRSDENTSGKVKEYVAGKDCLITTSSPIFLPIFSEMLMDADDIYISLSFGVTGDDSVYTQGDEILKLCSNSEFYLLMYNVNDDNTKEILSFLTDKTGYSIETSTSEIIHDSTATLYRLYK